MTVRERVLASRLIQKIDVHTDYAKQIGLSYIIAAETRKISYSPVQNKKENN